MKVNHKVIYSNILAPNLDSIDNTIVIETPRKPIQKKVSRQTILVYQGVNDSVDSVDTHKASNCLQSSLPKAVKHRYLVHEKKSFRIRPEKQGRSVKPSCVPLLNE